MLKRQRLIKECDLRRCLPLATTAAAGLAEGILRDDYRGALTATDDKQHDRDGEGAPDIHARSTTSRPLRVDAPSIAGRRWWDLLLLPLLLHQNGRHARGRGCTLRRSLVHAERSAVG